MRTPSPQPSPRLGEGAFSTLFLSNFLFSILLKIASCIAAHCLATDHFQYFLCGFWEFGAGAVDGSDAQVV